MRRFSTLTLSLLTVLLGLTAWAQASRQAAKAPRAVGDLTLVSANPASGSTITGELSVIETTWNLNLLPINDGEYVGEVLDAAGNKVADLDNEWGDDFNVANLVVRPGISDPGEYKVVIFSGAYGEGNWDAPDPNVTNDRIELTYTIAGGGEVVGTKPVVVTSTPSVAVAELTAFEVTFDQPVQLSVAASRVMFDVYPEGESGAVAGAYAAMKEGDDKTVVFSLSRKITDSNTYELVITEGMIFPKGATSDELGNEEISVFATVDSSNASFSKLELSYPSGDTIEGENFGNVNFTYANNATVNTSMEINLVDENGEKWPMEVRDMKAMTGTPMVILRAENVTISGTYTLTIPAGFVTEPGGVTNEVFTKTFTYTNPAQGSEDDRQLEIISATIVNDETGESIDLMNKDSKVPSFGAGWTIHVVPNIYDAIKEMHVVVTHEGIDEYGDEGIVYDKRLEMRESSGYKVNGEFTAQLYGVSKLEEGIEYTIEFDAEDTSIAPNLRKDWGVVTTTVWGGAKAYEYSPAELVSVYPEIDSEIFNPNQEFILTFSQPVDITAEFDQGMGFTSKIYTVQPNEDRTVWTFTLSPSIIEQETAQLGVIIFAKDLDGLVLKGNNGFEAKSCFRLQWDCHLGCPAVTVTPGSGTVESLFSFSATAEDGGNIALGSGVDKPYLTTASGARVAEVDMASEKLYDKDGKLLSLEDADDTVIAKIEFDLDKEITAPGKYILNIPFGAFSLGTDFSGSSNRPMKIEYIIEGTPEYDRVSIENGASLSELSYVVVYANADVDLADNARMQLRSEDGVLANAQLIPAVNNGVTMLIADFNQNGKPYLLEDGVDYTLRINANQVMLAGTEMSYPALIINVKGAGAAPATVKLTEEIAGFATTVSEVANGSSAVVTLTPAEGWKVAEVLLDGTDMSASVRDNVFTSPALIADAKLIVSFEYDGELFTPSNAADVVTDFALRAYSENGEIVLAGLKKGMLVNVFSVDGAKAGTYEVADFDMLNVKVPAGVYVVTVTFEGKTQAIKLQNK